MLQPSERSAIRLYLGYPDEFRYANTRLEGIFGSISDEAIDQVRNILSNLVAVDQQILTVGLTAGNIKRVDEITFFGAAEGGGTVINAKKIGRLYVSRLSVILGVPPYADYFGGSGYPGDSFSGLGGANGSRFFNVG